MDESYDIVIAGGGPAGLAAALALSAKALRVAVVESRARDHASRDERMIALAYGSRLILERVSAWQEVAEHATAINRIEVSEQRGFGRVTLEAKQARVPALGYVVSYHALERALASALSRSGATRIHGNVSPQTVTGAERVAVTIGTNAGERRIEAKLLVIADGSHASASQRGATRDYGQSALVCDAVSENAHDNRAFERFTRSGALALLPTQRGWSVVWTAPSARAMELYQCSDDAFSAALNAAFGTAVGRLAIAGPRSLFPLVLKRTQGPVAARTARIGNAAQTLHPVAGQGLNLGLRDAWELARVINRQQGSDPGASAILKNYMAQRATDRTATVLFTDTLIRLFSKDIPLLNAARSLGLSALGGLPFAKYFLVRRMMFGMRG